MPEAKTAAKAKTAEEVEVVAVKTPDEPRAVDVTYDGVQHVAHQLTGKEFDPGQTHRMSELEATDLVLRGNGLFTVRPADDSPKAPESNPDEAVEVEVEYLGAVPVSLEGKLVAPGDKVLMSLAAAKSNFLHLPHERRETRQARSR